MTGYRQFDSTRAGMTMRMTTVLLAATLALALSTGLAQADHGDPTGANFGIADAHNGPGDPGADVAAPAYPLAPGQTVRKAWWAGTCDLLAKSTNDGGVGTAPVTPVAHCIDHGRPYLCAIGGAGHPLSAPTCDAPDPPRTTTWAPGREPGWRFDPASQAGYRPDATGTFWLNRYPDIVNPGFGAPFPAASDGDAQTVMAKLPPGFVGNPNAVPKCPSSALQTVPPTCDPRTQVGVATLDLGWATRGAVADGIVYPIYNADARDGKTAEFMLTAGEATIRGNVPIVASARTDEDFGVDVVAFQVPGGLPLLGQTLTFWGVPWAASHDIYRPVVGYQGHNAPGLGGSGVPGAMPPTGLPAAGGGGDQSPQSYTSSWGPIKPFLSNPTRCTEKPLTTRLEINSWQNPTVRSYDAPADVVVDGCDKVPFEPDFSLQPANTAADAPTGLDVELAVPQNNDPPVGVANNPSDTTGAPAYWKSDAGLATAHLRDTVVTLPEGMALNPAAASGLDACSTAEIGLRGTDFPDPTPIRFDNSKPRCSDASKIGTVEVETPLLDDTLTGVVYLAKQTDNPFGTLLGLYIVVESEKRGVRVKLAGRVDPDPVTGQLKTTFADNPQVPFTRFRLRFKGGPTASLLTPPDCGVHETKWRTVAWTGKVVEGSDPFTIDKECAGSEPGFDPSFSAGAVSPVAGVFSPFVMRLGRNGVNQRELGRIAMKLPKGFTAKLKHVDVCSEAELAAAAVRSGLAAQAGPPSCPVGTQIGTATAGAGGGSNGADLFYFYPRLPNTGVSGRVYLTAPHRNTEFRLPGIPQADYGIAVEVPAVAGPFDLGNVFVRAAVYVDPITAEITVVSDRIPHILQGVRINARDIRVNVDRPNFSATPTSCAEKRIEADIHAVNGTLAQKGSRFQVGGCRTLALSPKLAMRLTGPRQRRTGGHPGLNTVLTQPAEGQSNLRRVVATLPGSLALDPRRARSEDLCEFEEGQKVEPNCPRSSIVGRAVAETPLLKRPLRAPVYFVKNVRIDPRTGNRIRTLPTLLLPFRGEVSVNVRAESNVRRDGRLTSTFANLPDAAVSRFRLNLAGGRDGILVVTRTRRGRIDLCAGRQVTSFGIRGHNGKLRQPRVGMRTPCTAAQRSAARRAAARRN